MKKDLLKDKTLYARRILKLLGLEENFVYEEDQPCDWAAKKSDAGRY